METLSTFLDMGGYARFVWPSFGLTFVVLVGLMVANLRALRGAEATLAALRTTEDGSPGNSADGADEA